MRLRWCWCWCLFIQECVHNNSFDELTRQNKAIYLNRNTIVHTHTYPNRWWYYLKYKQINKRTRFIVNFFFYFFLTHSLHYCLFLSHTNNHTNRHKHHLFNKQSKLYELSRIHAKRLLLLTREGAKSVKIIIVWQIKYIRILSFFLYSFTQTCRVLCLFSIFLSFSSVFNSISLAEDIFISNT